jgi:hypothetical protein
MPLICLSFLDVYGFIAAQGAKESTSTAIVNGSFSGNNNVHFPSVNEPTRTCTIKHYSFVKYGFRIRRIMY